MIAKINYDLCTGCKICYDDCPLDIITWNDEENKPNIAYPDECQLCFICQIECPENAIEVKVPIIFW